MLPKCVSMHGSMQEAVEEKMEHPRWSVRCQACTPMLLQLVDVVGRVVFFSWIINILSF
jgi:hypothetical protein